MASKRVCEGSVFFSFPYFEAHRGTSEGHLPILLPDFLIVRTQNPYLELFLAIYFAPFSSSPQPPSMREGESGKITDLLYVYDYLII